MDAVLAAGSPVHAAEVLVTAAAGGGGGSGAGPKPSVADHWLTAAGSPDLQAMGEWIGVIVKQ